MKNFQLNTKLTESEMQAVEHINTTIFNGKMNKSHLTRFLIKFAIDNLSKAKIESKVIVTVNGKSVDL